MIAFDTNIYIYTLDSDAPGKRDTAIAMLQSDSGTQPLRPLLWQVACEFLAFLRSQQSKRRIDGAAVFLEMRNLLDNHELIRPRGEIIHRSMDLASRYSLSHWDSLIIAACIDARIETLYSEDMSHETTYDTVRVVNPFAVS